MMNQPPSSPRVPGSETLPEASINEQMIDEGAMATPSVAMAPLPSAQDTPAPSSAWGGRLRDLWRMIILNPKMAVGLVIVLIFLLDAIFAPLFIHANPYAFSSDSLAPPSAQHWLGTTQQGQDVFLQLILGARVSIFVGFGVGIVATILSIIVGVAAGYAGGGWLDGILSMLTNIFLVLPGIVLAIVLASYLPVKGPIPIAVFLTVTGWAWGARVLRAQTLSLRNRDFVEAARASGEGIWHILLAEILPNEIAIVVSGFIGTVVYVILAEATLEFIGVGDPTIVSWGTMFYWAQNGDALVQGAWWWFVPPGLCIALIGAGLSLINFGIDEVANPRLRREAKPKKVKALAKTAKEEVA